MLIRRVRRVHAISNLVMLFRCTPMRPMRRNTSCFVFRRTPGIYVGYSVIIIISPSFDRECDNNCSIFNLCNVGTNALETTNTCSLFAHVFIFCSCSNSLFVHIVKHVFLSPTIDIIQYNIMINGPTQIVV